MTYRLKWHFYQKSAIGRKANKLWILREKMSDLIVVFLDKLKHVCILYGYNSGWDSSE